MSIILKIILVFVMTISGSMGAFFFKRGTSKLNDGSIFKMIFIPEIYIGGFFYLIGAATNIVLLRFMEYTIVYPMTALTYVWTMIISYFILRENMNKEKIVAIACIVLGIIILNI